MVFPFHYFFVGLFGVRFGLLLSKRLICGLFGDVDGLGAEPVDGWEDAFDEEPDAGLAPDPADWREDGGVAAEDDGRSGGDCACLPPPFCLAFLASPMSTRPPPRFWALPEAVCGWFSRVSGPSLPPGPRSPFAPRVPGLPPFAVAAAGRLPVFLPDAVLPSRPPPLLLLLPACVADLGFSLPCRSAAPSRPPVLDGLFGELPPPDVPLPLWLLFVLRFLTDAVAPWKKLFPLLTTEETPLAMDMPPRSTP
jgi:hypothetical protein